MSIVWITGDNDADEMEINNNEDKAGDRGWIQYGLGNLKVN